MAQDAGRILNMLDCLQERDGVDWISPDGRSRSGRGRSQHGRSRTWRLRVFEGLGVGINARHVRGSLREHSRAVALAAGHVDDALAVHAVARSSRRRRGAGGTSSSLQAGPEACALRSAPAAVHHLADSAVRIFRLLRACGPHYSCAPHDPFSRTNQRREHLLPRRGGRRVRRQVGDRLRRRRQNTSRD